MFLTPLGPNLAPALKEAAVSNGIPTIAKSNPSAEVAWWNYPYYKNEESLRHSVADNCCWSFEVTFLSKSLRNISAWPFKSFLNCSMCRIISPFLQVVKSYFSIFLKIIHFGISFVITYTAYLRHFIHIKIETIHFWIVSLCKSTNGNNAIFRYKTFILFTSIFYSKLNKIRIFH